MRSSPFILLALVTSACWTIRDPTIPTSDDTGTEADADTDTDSDSDSDADSDTDADTDPPTDADSDGYTDSEDCDDANASTYPGAGELCDGLDNDCDGLVDNDCYAQSTDWLVLDGADLGIDHNLVFTWIEDDGSVTVADPDDVCAAGYGFGGDEDWNYDEDRATIYEDGMDWFEFPEDIIFRITYRTHGSSSLESTWAQYAGLCEDPETTSDLCWWNLGGAQDDGWALCLKNKNGGLVFPGFEACEKTPDPEAVF